MAITNAVVAPYASEIVSGFDIWKPEKLNTLFRAKGDQGMSYFMLLKSLGFEWPTAQDEYGHYEERLIHQTFTTTTNVGDPGAGANIALVINTADDASNVRRLYPRVWDTVMFPNEVTGTIISITVAGGPGFAATLTIRPNVATDNIGAIASGTQVVIISNAFSEGSSQPAGRFAGTTQYTNNVQIIKETLTATGTEMTNQDWFDQISEPGSGKILGYYMKGQMDIDYRIALASSNALLFQKRTPAGRIVDGTTNRDIKTTEGLIPYIRRVGQTVQYNQAVGFGLADFDDINRRLDQEFAGMDVMGLVGIDLQLAIDNTLFSEFKFTDVSYVTQNLFGGDSKLAMSVNFQSINKGDRVFSFKRLGTFSNPVIGGAPGYNFSQMGVFLPMGTKKDPINGTELPSIGCRYKALGPYNRRMEVWNVSGAGPGAKVIAEDLHNHYMRCHIGAHHIAGNRFVLVEPQ